MTLWITLGESLRSAAVCALSVRDSAAVRQPSGRRRAAERVSDRSYFHCVETPNPAAMKPKPTTMFQLPSASKGSWVSVT